MPGTAPEAADLAGLPWDEHRYRTDADSNIMLGRAYFREQLRVFGDPATAAAAYNAGPGAMRRALRMACDRGGPWDHYLPAETQKYLKDFRAKVGK
jgi:soluble lytic murein transglycosylase-like protein